MINKTQFDGTSFPAPYLDELSRRRWTDQVLVRFSASPAVHSQEREGTTKGYLTTALKWTAVAAVLAMILGVGWTQLDISISQTDTPALASNEPSKIKVTNKIRIAFTKNFISSIPSWANDCIVEKVNLNVVNFVDIQDLNSQVLGLYN